MITLHRLGHAAEPFHLNPDLIVTVEANPDTVVTLTTGTKIVVAEPPDRVVGQIREYRVRHSRRRAERRKEEGSPSHTPFWRAGRRRACSSRSSAATRTRRTTRIRTRQHHSPSVLRESGKIDSFAWRGAAGRPRAGKHR